MNVWTKALPVGATKHPQADLPAFSTNGADNRRTVVFIRPVSLRLVGSAPGRILRIAMGLSFFPAF